MNATVSSKGQITLPRFAREALGLRAGSAVSVTLEGRELKLRLAPAGTARRMAGSLRAYARPGSPRSVRDHVRRKVSGAAATRASA